MADERAHAAAPAPRDAANARSARRPRALKVLFAVLSVCAILVIVAAIAVARYDWNRAKPWIAATVGHALGREIAIDGDLTLGWQRDPMLRGWRAWVPGPHVTASRVTIGNPDWAKSRAFARVDQVELDLDVLPLLAHTISIPALRFVNPDVHLERTAQTRNNWTFGNDDGASPPWNVEVGHIRFAHGTVSISDRVRQLEAKITLDNLHAPVPFEERRAQQETDAQREAAQRIGNKGATSIAKTAATPAVPRTEPQHYVFHWSANGSTHGKPLKGEGEIGGVLALRDAEQPFPLSADLRVGETRVALLGTLTDPRDPQGLDLRMWLSGASLSDLYDIFEVTLPQSRSFATNGRLIGHFGKQVELRYEKFSAHVGESDLSGTLTYATRDQRPLLSGTIDSSLLQFRDLAPLIGVNGTRGDEAKASNGKVLPEEPFRPERWQAMDADVHFTGDHVFRDEQLPIHRMDTRVVMDDGVLAIAPLKFRYANGDVDAQIRMDGRQAPIKGTIKASAQGVQLKHVFQTADSSQLDLGDANATIDLAGTGNSVGDLLGAANGEVKALLDSGSISKGLIETISLNVPNIVATKLFGDRQVEINCAAADFVATKGSYESRLFVIDTDAAQINVTGNIDLASETLDLTLHPDTKGLRLLSLRAPIHVTGTFARPQGGVDKGVLLARSAGAVGLAVVATPVAALLPLTQTSIGGKDHRCTALLTSMRDTAQPLAIRK